MKECFSRGRRLFGLSCGNERMEIRALNVDGISKKQKKKKLLWTEAAYMR